MIEGEDGKSQEDFLRKRELLQLTSAKPVLPAEVGVVPKYSNKHQALNSNFQTEK